MSPFENHHVGWVSLDGGLRGTKPIPFSHSRTQHSFVYPKRAIPMRKNRWKCCKSRLNVNPTVILKEVGINVVNVQILVPCSKENLWFFGGFALTDRRWVVRIFQDWDLEAIHTRVRERQWVAIGMFKESQRPAMLDGPQYSLGSQKLKTTHISGTLPIARIGVRKGES